MATAIFMPKAGMAMEEGTLVRWLKNVGDPVEMNEPIMEIETDKITMESEAPASGVLLAKLVEEGTVVPVLQTIGWIGEKGEKIPEAEEAAAPKAEVPDEKVSHAPTEDSSVSEAGEVKATPYAKKLAKEMGIPLSDINPSGHHGEVTGTDVKKVRVTPLAKRIAADKGVDLSTVSGSGHGGKIMKQDVLATASAQKPSAAPAASAQEETRVKIPNSRKVLAERMQFSHTNIPAVTQTTVVDVTELLLFREQLNEKREKEERFSINDLILKACAMAVHEFPCMRTMIDGDEFVVKSGAHIGFAVGTEESLLVPVLHDAQNMSLSALSKKVKDLIARARSGNLRLDEMGGSTFTVSNLGMFDVESFTPMINAPDAAIIGIGCVRDELVLEDGNVAVRKVMRLCLSYDHRILDGVLAAKFSKRLKHLLENPLDILL